MYCLLINGDALLDGTDASSSIEIEGFGAMYRDSDDWYDSTVLLVVVVTWLLARVVLLTECTMTDLQLVH